MNFTLLFISIPWPWNQVLFLATWPLVILLSYWLVGVYLKKLDKKLAEDGEEI